VQPPRQQQGAPTTVRCGGPPLTAVKLLRSVNSAAGSSLANRLETQMWAGRPCIPAVCRDEWMRQRIKALKLLVPPGRDSAVTLSDESGHVIQRDQPSLVASAIRGVLALSSAR
jgi:hypothetical protein